MLNQLDENEQIAAWTAFDAGVTLSFQPQAGPVINALGYGNGDLALLLYPAGATTFITGTLDYLAGSLTIRTRAHIDEASEQALLTILHLPSTMTRRACLS